MKKIIITIIAGILAARIIQAQGTVTYLSNLGQSSVGSVSLGTNFWLALGFHTGTNAGGYMLNSVQLAMAAASGNPSGFLAMVYGRNPSNSAADLPGSSIGGLSGSVNPITTDIFTYTSASNVTLSAGTYYFVVLTAASTIANGAYNWSLSSSNFYNPSGHWSIIGGASTDFLSSNNGSSWNSIPFAFPQLAISATAIPEPGVLSLLGLGGLALLWKRRKTGGLR